MLKAVVISDLHGVFSDSLRRAIIGEEPDIILCCGDVTPFRLKEAFFEYIYADYDQEKHLWDYIGKPRYRSETRKDLADAMRVLAALDDLPFPVRFVPGNNDNPLWEQERRPERMYDEPEWEWVHQNSLDDFVMDLFGVKDISYGADIVGDYVFIGYPASNSPGHVQSDVYRRHRRWLDNVFSEFERKKHEDKSIVFVCHNGPHETKTDLITAEGADERARGEHYGSKLARRIIERYQPTVCVHGHIDEGRGTDRIGDTDIVNVGPGSEGYYGVLTIDDGCEIVLDQVS